ncbi:TPM domain-containing protein [Acuticoccus kandeliae]|uniref:TPM domain-containing protein n=1 Tax=Acuticoccus kandeliae TaxID=2073160 RepID=UPI000D3EB93B|nr:TPM domain-containing protein [Acuticoccus kandeliae]
MRTDHRAVRLAASALLLLVLLSAEAALAQTFPTLSGRVVDQADILPPDVEKTLSDRLAAHETKTSTQVVVVTLPDLQGYDIADYGYRLGREWKIGTEADNGVLLIVAPNDRRVRIEVGYGLEGTLTDAQSRAIIDSAILPAFRDGDLPRGVEAGTAAILTVLDGDPIELPVAADTADDIEGIFVVVANILIFVFIMYLVSRNNGGGGGIRRGSGGRPIILYPGRSGGSSRGRSSGGFSGRGGSFGGGGASGSW